MANYTIIPQDSPGDRFDVLVEGTNGTRQVMLGFATEADANAWIVEDKAIDAGWMRIYGRRE